MAELTQDHKLVAKGAFWSLSGGLIFKFLGLVYTILLARLFVPSDVGIFYLGLGIVYLVGNFSDLGFNAALGRYLPYFIGKGDLKKAGGIASATYLSSGILSLFFALSLFFLSGPISNSFMQPELAPVLMILSLFLLINNLFGVNIAILGSLMKIKETNFLNNLWSILKILTTLLFFWLIGENSIVIAASLTASYLVILAISGFYVKKAANENKIRFQLGEWKEKLSLLKKALPIGLAIMLIAEITALAFYTDRIMMGWLLPPEIASEYIGIYTMALSMALIIPIFPAAVTGIFAPLIAKLHGMGKREDLERISKTSARWNIFLLAPAAIIMVAFSGEIMQLFYGAAYTQGGIVLAILSIGIFFRYLASVQGTILGAMRIVKIELLAAGVGFSLNLVLNFFLIPQYGMMGAAIASSLSLLATATVLAYYCKKIIGSAFLREIIVPVLVAVVAFLAVFAVKDPLWAATNGMVDQVIAPDGLLLLIAQKLAKAAVLGVVLAMVFGIYFAMLVALKGIKGEDWAVLSASMRKAKVPENLVAKVETFSKRFY